MSNRKQVPAGTRKQRIRSPHPGVVLIKPDVDARHTYWRARYRDPDTGHMVKVRLDPKALPNADARRDWAIRKSKTLSKRSMDLEAGAPRATGTALGDAVGRYFKDHPHIREATRELYQAAAGKLLAWAARAKVRCADDLVGAHLVAFRAELVREPKRGHVKGGKRGAMQETTAPRSGHTVNRELRSVRTVLGYLRSLGLLPRLSSDALKDSLKRVPVTVELMHYMKPRELRRLLEAALAHDAATFKATRAELAGNGKPGTTRCYTPIAPLVAAATLTGMRFSELVDLDWRQVDLDASGHDGTPVGEIRLTSATKTRRARLVGLEVCPTLRALLDLMHDKRSKGLVFGLKEDEAKAAARRLVAEYDAPDSFNWQALRRTAGTFLTNAPGIYGAASAYHSAKQLGHSVQVAEKHYVGVVRGIPAEAKTLEAAMQIETEMARVVEAERGRDG